MIREVNIFRAGTQTSAQGVTREFTKDDLSEIASSYDPQVHEAPIRIGHEDNDKVPAWGWVKGVKLKGDQLYAEVDFSPLAEDYIKNGLYKKVSASFYSPESKINPEPGKWSLRHVALLGAQPPAVKGLKGFAYEESDEGVVDFASEMTLEAVFDPELGPTLKRDVSPLEILKEKLDEARSQMKTADLEKEQELEAPAQVEEETPEGEFAEGMMKSKKPKKVAGEKQGMEGEKEEEDMEGEDSTDMASCGSKKKMSYEEADSEEHGEATAEHDGKVKGLKAPAPKGMSGMEPETVDGEGPVASKVKKDPKSGACDPECEDDEKKFEEPSFEASKKKRGTDHMNASDVGTKETEDGPGGLVRTRSTSKGVNLGYAEGDEDLESDDEQHAEDTDPYTKRASVGKPGAEGETDRGMKGTAPEIKGFEGQEKGTHSAPKGYDGKTVKDGSQDADRKKVGKAKEIKGYPDKYETLSNGSGGGKQVKGGKVRVMYVNHAEEAPVSKIEEMMARLEELEAANAKLKAEAEFAERKAHRMQLEQFVSGLYETGKLTDAVVTQEDLTDYMEGLEYGTLEFAEGETAATPLMRILDALPSQVCYEEVAGGENFVNEEELDPHQKAVKLSKEEGIEYAEALKQVLFSAE
jgi:hypothetical protein